VTYSLTEAAIELVPVIAALGEWGLRNRATTPTLRVRAELLAAGGPALWEDFMAELRTEHLGVAPPSGAGPSATERLAAAYAVAVARVPLPMTSIGEKETDDHRHHRV
jgi:hypothetical protein